MLLSWTREGERMWEQLTGRTWSVVTVRFMRRNISLSLRSWRKSSSRSSFDCSASFIYIFVCCYVIFVSCFSFLVLCANLIYSWNLLFELRFWYKVGFWLVDNYTIVNMIGCFENVAICSFAITRTMEIFTNQILWCNF